MNLKAEEGSEADGENSQKREDDPAAIEELDRFRAEKKPSFLELGETKNQRREPTVAKRHLSVPFRLSESRESSVAALLDLLF